MRKVTLLVTAVLVVITSGLVFTDDGGRASNFRLRLRGLDEVPVISTAGSGTFRAKINEDETEIAWRLTFSNLEGVVQQSHIHFGPPNNTGGISIFLCSNLGNGPAGTQACPLTNPATVEGTARAVDVIGPTAQGIEAGALAEIIAAIRDGKAYVNVHSTKWPAGEIRQQFPRDDHHD